MKRVFKILVALVIIVVVLLGAGYLILTNSGFQTRMVEKRLPEGSSVKQVKVTTGRASISGLILALPDGTKVKLEALDTSFSPLAALFDNTIQLGELKVEGLFVDTPTVLLGSDAEAGVPGSDTTGSSGSSQKASGASSPSATKRSGSPMESLYGLGDLDWLFVIDGIQIDGGLRDGAGNRFKFKLDADPLRPGERSKIQTSLTLDSSESLQAGVESFGIEGVMELSQLSRGGFDEVNFRSQINGTDASGTSIVTASQNFKLKLDSTAEEASIALEFSAKLPRPELFVPELASLGAVESGGQFEASVAGETVRVTQGRAFVANNGAHVMEFNLKQKLTLDAGQHYTGDLVELQVKQLPMSWINPWLPEGLFIQGDPVSLALLVSGESGGGLRLTSLQPVQVGPLTITQDESPLLEQVSFKIQPELLLKADRSVAFNLNAIQVLDRYGSIVSASAQGTVVQVDRTAAEPFAGILADATLDTDLASVFRQPVFQQKYGLLAGRLKADLSVRGAEEYPLQLTGELNGLRVPDEASPLDYRFAAQVKQQASGAFAVGLNLEAGLSARPSTHLEFAGEVDPAKTPIPVTAKLEGDRVTQSDLMRLASAFSPRETGTTPKAPAASTSGRNSSPNTPAGGSVTTETTPPPWAMLDGKASVSVKEIYLDSGQTIRNLDARAKVSEPLLALEHISASMGDGTIDGNSSVRYEPDGASAYAVLADLGFKQIDPSIFSKPGARIPVSGKFDGSLKAEGAGQSLEAALDDATGELSITGTNGVVSAFELDDRSKLGLIGVSILGQSLDRPGVTALANTVPYFKDIHFEEFAFKLTRGDDKRLLIPQLKVLGESLLLDASGFVAASSLSEVMDQPLSLSMELGAKGRLTTYLETLQLLMAETADDGFRRWNKTVDIGGTLGDPDTDALMDMLKTAANNALTKPGKSKTASSETTPAATTEAQSTDASQQLTDSSTGTTETKKKKTKEEKRREDIEMGLDLLNTVLGN
ncbi:hypothetical protein [Coraliomargarita parva]|uniref:hypothetical protein n=1 Tax=Coraliomargarita parva TaxID=3014050 RepID=UPI0022B2BC3F|nr:hypothetical protein [Coraliomargarita parva]